MKALTLYQPWASLIPPGWKKIETRSWSTKYRGPLAIHAAKDQQYWTVVAHDEPFRSVLMESRLFRQYDLPYGAVVAVCNLVDCVKVIGLTRLEGRPVRALLENGQIVEGNELAFGDYTPGRFAWILKDARPLHTPIPAKGKQGLWTWEPPEGVTTC